MIFDKIKIFLDKIPTIVGTIRGAIEYVLGLLNMPVDPTYSLVVAVLSLIGAYFWIKQWIAGSLLLRLSTLLNYFLMSLLIYTLLNYV